jgi:hypothetical protein
MEGIAETLLTANYHRRTSGHYPVYWNEISC